MRIFTVSDLHVDYYQNQKWVNHISNEEHQEDLLILAGDISDDFKKCITTLEILKNKFKSVTFTPGNHDLWIKNNDFIHSIAKHQSLLQTAEQLDIPLRPFVFNEYNIVPISGWYDYSFGQPSENLKLQWADYYKCKWDILKDHHQIANYFFDQNETLTSNNGLKTISFSHFVPRMDALPVGPPPIIHFLAPCLGSFRIDDLVQQWASSVHIFGHSHLNRDLIIGNIRYINNSFGYPTEKHITRKHLMEIQL